MERRKIGSPEIPVHDPLDPYYFIATLLYTGLGILVFLLAFWLMGKVAPFSLRKEIEEDQNTALGIILGALLIGIAIIIAAAVSG